MSNSNETPLTGGNVNAEVVKVGNTVRRKPSKHALTIHRFLKHLAFAGFTQAPNFLGTDERGREILSYIEGETDFPADIWENEKTLDAAVNMLRRFHDASAEFIITADDSWAYRHSDPNMHEVICHNDFAPYNMIFKNGTPVGVIDFDLIGPGPRIRDLAYFTYWMVPLSFASDDMNKFTEIEIKNSCPRLNKIAETYGDIEILGLINAIEDILAHMCNTDSIREMIGTAALDRLEKEGHVAHWLQEYRAFQENKGRLIDCFY